MLDVGVEGLVFSCCGGPSLFIPFAAFVFAPLPFSCGNTTTSDSQITCQNCLAWRDTTVEAGGEQRGLETSFHFRAPPRGYDALRLCVDLQSCANVGIPDSTLALNLNAAKSYTTNLFSLPRTMQHMDCTARVEPQACRMMPLSASLPDTQNKEHVSVAWALGAFSEQVGKWMRLRSRKRRRRVTMVMATLAKVTTAVFRPRAKTMPV